VRSSSKKVKGFKTFDLRAEIIGHVNAQSLKDYCTRSQSIFSMGGACVQCISSLETLRFGHMSSA